MFFSGELCNSLGLNSLPNLGVDKSRRIWSDLMGSDLKYCNVRCYKDNNMCCHEDNFVLCAAIIRILFHCACAATRIML